MAAPADEAGRKRAHPTYLYARLLGGAWTGLPEPIRRMHALDGQLSAAGRARVQRGSGLLANMVAGMAGLPPAANEIDLRVDFERQGDVEIWTRRYGDHVMRSTQETGRERRLVEKIGPFAFAMTLTWDGKKLNLRVKKAWFGAMSLPAWATPRTTAYEEVIDGRFTFFVEITHPWTGLIVRYRGWLEPIIFAAAPE